MNTKRLQGIAASILSADFAHLGDQVNSVLDAGAAAIHIDVMDGHFVPPITFGPIVVEALHDQIHARGGIVDVHLMVDRPEKHVSEFAQAGADYITVHSESTPHLQYVIDAIRNAGCKPGVSINPATAPETIAEVADDIDLCLCMSVNPGWGGQRFIPRSIEKLKRLRQLLPADVILSVDGGINLETAGQCRSAGADLLVAGSSIFHAESPGDAVRSLAQAIGK